MCGVSGVASSPDAISRCDTTTIGVGGLYPGIERTANSFEPLGSKLMILTNVLTLVVDCQMMSGHRRPRFDIWKK